MALRLLLKAMSAVMNNERKAVALGPVEVCQSFKQNSMERNKLYNKVICVSKCDEANISR